MTDFISPSGTIFQNNVITGNPVIGIQVQDYGSIKNNAIINAGRVFHANLPTNPVYTSIIISGIMSNSRALIYPLSTALIFLMILCS